MISLKVINIIAITIVDIFNYILPALESIAKGIFIFFYYLPLIIGVFYCIRLIVCRKKILGKRSIDCQSSIYLGSSIDFCTNVNCETEIEYGYKRPVRHKSYSRSSFHTDYICRKCYIYAKKINFRIYIAKLMATMICIIITFDIYLLTWQL